MSIFIYNAQYMTDINTIEVIANGQLHEFKKFKTYGGNFEIKNSIDSLVRPTKNDYFVDVLRAEEGRDSEMQIASTGQRDRNQYEQQSIRMLTDLTEAIPEEKSANEIITQSMSDIKEDKEAQERRLRISHALTKIRKSLHSHSTINPEVIPDYYFSQEELQKLVEEAEFEIFRRKAKEKEKLNRLTTGITTNGGNETDFIEQLKAIEYQILDFDEKAKKGDKKAKKELGLLMV